MTKIKGYVEKLLHDCDEQYKSWLEADLSGRRDEDDEHDNHERRATESNDNSDRMIEV
ncbi:hypothetical protein [Pelagibacterium xiamenense]|uniref:hypothetical protein n=1 Tax=Pelagibacterium xiamenense TaxID=2901140 RepID=UPI001E2ADED4|nr:hypothetical protein [Pelagibacterium xiamenense]MCD7058603.1 hypothetical protein [Pelagibacterium xiamenense]